MICCGRSAPSRRREVSGMIEMRRAQLSFGAGLIDCGRIRIKNLSDALIRDQPACHGCLRLGTSTRHLGTSMPSRGRPPHHSPICRFPLRFRHDGRGCIKHPETAFRGAILMVRVNDLVYPSMDRAPHKMRLARGGRWVKTASPWLCGGRWRVFRQGRSPPAGGFVPRRYPSAQYRNARGFQATGTLCTSTRNSERPPATADA